MSTRNEIINIADDLIRSKGFNAFSFSDISSSLGIKNASIHYHFPTKGALGETVVQKHINDIEALIAMTQEWPPLNKLEAFMDIYSSEHSQGNVCVVGSLSTDLNTVNEDMKAYLKELVFKILNWVTDILEEGRSRNMFKFGVEPREKALLICTNMLASLQITRLSGNDDFELIKKTVIKELTE
ncbi:MAG: TetR/AcrR family transcriptional regulator [Bacteroidota bacterium]